MKEYFPSDFFFISPPPRAQFLLKENKTGESNDTFVSLVSINYVVLSLIVIFLFSATQ